MSGSSAGLRWACFLLFGGFSSKDFFGRWGSFLLELREGWRLGVVVEVDTKA